MNTKHILQPLLRMLEQVADAARVYDSTKDKETTTGILCRDGQRSRCSTAQTFTTTTYGLPMLCQKKPKLTARLQYWPN
jgi:hypothetical protein